MSITVQITISDRDLDRFVDAYNDVAGDLHQKMISKQDILDNIQEFESYTSNVLHNFITDSTSHEDFDQLYDKFVDFFDPLEDYDDELDSDIEDL